MCLRKSTFSILIHQILKYICFFSRYFLSKLKPRSKCFVFAKVYSTVSTNKNPSLNLTTSSYAQSIQYEETAHSKLIRSTLKSVTVTCTPRGWISRSATCTVQYQAVVISSGPKVDHRVRNLPQYSNNKQNI